MARILIVDDSRVSRMILRKILTEEGHLVLEAHDGMTALEQYSLHKPDLVLLDMTMPGMHGLDVLEKLREMDEQACVIAATADIQSMSRSLAEAAGVRDYISKPLSSEKVLRAVNRVLGEADNDSND